MLNARDFYELQTNLNQYRQGDIYRSSDFTAAKIPNSDIQYWMLANRSCQLVTGNKRKIKLSHLNFFVIHDLRTFLTASGSDRNIRNQIKELIKSDSFIYLPECTEKDINTPLIGNFNLMYTFNKSDCPLSEQKVLQLSSPFCEHVFQKLSRYFYTVGFEDEQIRSEDYINSVIEQINPRNKIEG